MSDSRKHRKVNQILGKQASFGPVPAEHLVPWFLISLVITIITNGLFSASFELTAILVFWGCGTWWYLAGKHPWKFLSKFISPPRWSKGKKYHKSIFLDKHKK